MNSDKIIIPPIKSQGIKTKLIPFIDELILKNKDYNWIEPFMGTGVVGFNLANLNKNSIMADTNPHLINFYNNVQKGEINSEVVKDSLIFEGAKLKETDGKYYYEVRERFNKNGSSLDFLFLTRANFNGLMRFNKSGGFNSPFCKKPERFYKGLITKISNQVKNVENLINSGNFEFKNQSFIKTISEAGENDLIYCDPPYIARHSDYFNKWTEEDEKNLANSLINSKADFILSTWSHNSYRKNEYITKFYSDFDKITKDHYYHVGGKVENRRGMTEALIYRFS